MGFLWPAALENGATCNEIWEKRLGRGVGKQGYLYQYGERSNLRKGGFQGARNKMGVL